LYVFLFYLSVDVGAFETIVPNVRYLNYMCVSNGPVVVRDNVLRSTT